MNQLLSIVDDALVIKKLSVQTLDGPIEANNDFRVAGNIFVERDIKARRNLEVFGTLTVDTIKVKNLVAENESMPAIDPNIDFTYVGKGEKEIDGKGLIWLDGETGSKQLVYKEGNKLWSTMHIDLAKDRAFKINKSTVLTSTELGSSVVKSNLRQVGELEGLKVSGQVEIDNWVFFNSYNNCIGINTESPNATLGVVVENGIEVIIGSRDDKTATLGTFSANTLELVTDNKARVSLRENGEVHFGNAKFKNAVVKIFGKLEVDELVANNSKQAQDIILFESSDNSSMYQKGILWKDEERTRYLVYSAGPDRIFSTDTFDLASNKWYSIDNAMVLSRTTLGTCVTESSLEKVGILRDLTVNGHTNLLGTVNIPNLIIDKVITDNDFNITISGHEEFKIVKDGDIVIGINDNNQRNINLHGKIKINGQLNLNSQQIISAQSAPVIGSWRKGDICFNNNPEMESYIGWVCVRDGEPGLWCPFGLIMPVRS
ncbi:hypothetical protein EBU71_16010 [bacterium]|nr:hypothetical protein [Candidatus Elulimicrobium humile]